MPPLHTFACLWTLMPQMVSNAHIVSKLRKVWISKGCLFMATCLQRWQRANLQHPTNHVSIDFRLSHSLVILRRLCFQWAMAFLQLCCLSIPSIGTLQSNTHMHTALHHFKDSNSKHSVLLLYDSVHRFAWRFPGKVGMMLALGGCRANPGKW